MGEGAFIAELCSVLFSVCVCEGRRSRDLCGARTREIANSAMVLGFEFFVLVQDCTMRGNYCGLVDDLWGHESIGSQSFWESGEASFELLGMVIWNG